MGNRQTSKILSTFHFTFAFALLLCSSFATVGWAAPIVTYDYIAIGEDDDVGSTITGTFGWDLAIPDTDGEAEEGEYVGAGFFTGLVTGGILDGKTFSLTGSTVFVVNSGSNDTFGMNFSTATDNDFILEDSFVSVFSSDALPTGPIDPADFSQTEINVTTFDTGTPSQSVMLEALFTSITLQSATPIPEPSTFALLALGLAGIGFRRRQAH